jgi:hypothetical protein
LLFSPNRLTEYSVNILHILSRIVCKEREEPKKNSLEHFLKIMSRMRPCHVGPCHVGPRLT